MNCINCSAPLGAEPKRAPVHAGDGERTEIFCPRCFVWKRAPMERGRFHGCAAIACSSCGWESVEFGLGRCPMCSSRWILTLPPAPEAPP
jgi:DNA-directed RNA polymerase subunit RPC12/RpoP